ncbi:MAG: hypothetical protein RLZZ337_954 [Bacteroidota bacterium]|jgi:hypothetical protein
MKALLVFTILFSSFLSFAQSADLESANSKQEFKDKFYLGLVSSYYIDFVTTPLTSSKRYIGDIVDPNDPTKTIPNYGNVPSQTTYNSFFSMGLEPRYNLKDINENLSVAVALPLTIGFGQAFPANENVQGSFGFGSIQFPLMTKIYFGSGSTYASNEDFGLSAGFGMEFNKIGLFSPGATEEEQNALKPWVMPVASAGVHFWRGNTPMEVNVKYGFGPIEYYQTDKFGQPLLAGTRTTRASSIKLTFVYLMNY